MEAALLHWPADHESMPSYNKARNPKRNSNQTRSLIPSSIGNLYYSESLPKMVNGGVFLNPLSSSLPRLNSSPHPLQHHQPPLLPLPAPSRSLPTSGAATQLSPSHKKQTKGNKSHQTNTKQGTKSVSNNRVGPNPESLPKKQLKFSGSVFPEAPPPSSLPMPKFSLKPKMSCRVEATGSGGGVRVDSAGSTSNLCRLLNLR